MKNADVRAVGDSVAQGLKGYVLEALVHATTHSVSESNSPLSAVNCRCSLTPHSGVEEPLVKGQTRQIAQDPLTFLGLPDDFGDLRAGLKSEPRR